MAIFNTLQYARKLEAAGVSTQQAEVQSYALAEIIEGVMVTKADLEKLEMSVLSKMHELDTRLSLRIDTLENRLTIKLGGMMFAMFVVGVSILKFLK